MNKNNLPGLFVEREQCIACGSRDLRLLAGAAFEEEPVHSFISNDPWGESPVPYLEGESWEYVRCNQCEQMFHKKIIASEWVETLFSKWMSREAMEEFERRGAEQRVAASFEKARAFTRHVLILDQLTAFLRNNESMRILDYGCGWGEFLSVAKRFGSEVYGVDVDPDRLEVAGGSELEVFSDLDVMDPSLKGNLHVITLFQVLEHLPAPLLKLEEIVSWLMPGGVLILETPNCSGICEIRTIREYRKINPLSHINAFTPKSLQTIARRAGFDPIFPGVAHATTSPMQVLKTEIKRQIGRFLPATTNQYFRRR